MAAACHTAIKSKTSEALTPTNLTRSIHPSSNMLFLLVFRCGKHKIRPDSETNKLSSSNPSFSSSDQNSIYMVMMRMEAEKVQQQIKTCLVTLKQLQPGQVRF